MTPISLILLTFTALVAMGLVARLFAARRRRTLRNSRLAAALLRKKGEAWERLKHSAAGAP